MPSLLDVMKLIAKERRQSPKLAAKIFRVLPSQLQNCRVNFSEGTWFYLFAANYKNLPEDWTFIGTDQCVPVERLYLGLCSFSNYFSKKTLCDFIKRLGDPGKHLDTLAEMAPLLRTPASIEGDYEPAGIGAKPIDYVFKPKNGCPILLDVKCRTKGKIDHFKEIIPHINTRNSSFEGVRIN